MIWTVFTEIAGYLAVMGFGAYGWAQLDCWWGQINHSEDDQ